MKKLFIVALAAFVSACSCFECEDDGAPVTTYQTARKASMDCDYFDGKTCYRYVYKNIQRPVAQPAVVRQRPCETTQPSCGCSNCGCNNCGPKISETREPVEVIYKKTTYKTVCDPKTYSQVSYERLPYASASNHESVEVVDNTKVVLDEIK